MGIYFGDKFFGFRCSLITESDTGEDEMVYENKFDNLDNEISEQIMKQLSTFNDSKHIFHIYDSFTDTYDDTCEIGYMWRLIEKKYLLEYLNSVIIKNNKEKLLLEQRERCGIKPYQKTG